MMMIYSHSILIFKIYDTSILNTELHNLDFEQIFTPRTTKFEVSARTNYNIGDNILLKRFSMWKKRKLRLTQKKYWLLQWQNFCLKIQRQWHCIFAKLMDTKSNQLFVVFKLFKLLFKYIYILLRVFLDKLFLRCSFFNPFFLEVKTEKEKQKMKNRKGKTEKKKMSHGSAFHFRFVT